MCIRDSHHHLHYHHRHRQLIPLFRFSNAMYSTYKVLSFEQFLNTPKANSSMRLSCRYLKWKKQISMWEWIFEAYTCLVWVVKISEIFQFHSSTTTSKSRPNQLGFSGPEIGSLSSIIVGLKKTKSRYSRCASRLQRNIKRQVER